MSAALKAIRELEQLGSSLMLEGDAIRYRVPKDKAEVEALLAELRRHRDDAIRILRERVGLSSGSSGNINAAPRAGVGSCVYDWLVGFRWQKLRCVAHERHSDSATVFRVLWSGYDTLSEMHRLGVLTGRALEDAKALAKLPIQ
jgi:hypothetical protein